jgi:hypothetical protein
MSGLDGADVGGVPLAILGAAAQLRTAADELQRHRSSLSRWRHVLSGQSLGDQRVTEAFATSCDAWSLALDRVGETLAGLEREATGRAQALLEAGGG